MNLEYRARPATKSDEDDIVNLGKAALEEAPLTMPFDEAWMRKTVAAISRPRPEAFASVLDHHGECVGMLLAIATQSPISPVLISQELSFYVSPDHRGNGRKPLLDAYRAWGFKLGVKRMGLSLFHDPRNVPVMDRLGFKAAETLFFMDL